VSETISIPFELAPTRGDAADEPRRTRYHPSMPTREEARRIWPYHAILEVIGPDGVSRFEPVQPMDDMSDQLLDGCTVRWPTGS